MKTFLMTTVFSGLMAFPAFAQMSDDMSCADFMAMDASAQMKAVMEADSTASDDMMADDAMAEDTMAEDAMAEDAMADDAMAEDDMMAKDDMMADEMAVSVESVAAICADNPDMMVHDAMMQAMEGN